MFSGHVDFYPSKLIWESTTWIGNTEMWSLFNGQSSFTATFPCIIYSLLHNLAVKLRYLLQEVIDWQNNTYSLVFTKTIIYEMNIWSTIYLSHWGHTPIAGIWKNLILVNFTAENQPIWQLPIRFAITSSVLLLARCHSQLCYFSHEQYGGALSHVSTADYTDILIWGHCLQDKTETLLQMYVYILYFYYSVYMSKKIDTLNIYTLLHEEFSQVVSTIQWIPNDDYNGLHEVYIHAMRKCHLWECDMIVMPIVAGEHWLLLDTRNELCWWLTLEIAFNTCLWVTIYYLLLFTKSLGMTQSEYVIAIYCLLRVWEWH